MDSGELRSAFLKYFEEKGHTIVESASLVPSNDPSLLFTNAGMVPFKDAFAFVENRGYTRAVSCQRCLRAGGKHNDLDNVGYTARHHTFFEMLGNFSFGDYFKEDAISFAWEFLTKVVGLPPEKLWVTVHESDDEAEQIWLKKIGVSAERITRLGDKDNFWTMGDTGPCGPSSEIFYDHGPEVPGGPPGSEDGELDRYIEIWNLVFTQYERSKDGTLSPLPKPCVDTGMGLERLSAVVQGVHDNYETDLFNELIREAAKLLGSSHLHDPSLKVIADHIRAAVFLIADGVLPSNEGRGYVNRRIIRRALRHGHKLNASVPFFHNLVSEVVVQMGRAYPSIAKTQKQIERILLKEEQQFALTLDQGMSILSDAIGQSDEKQIPGNVVFKLYDTYGFPTDLTADIAREQNLTIDLEGFDREMDAQRARARAASRFASPGLDGISLTEKTEFIGYEVLEGEATVSAIIVDGALAVQADANQEASIVLDRTPFYGESGGQAGDTGHLVAGDAVMNVIDTTRIGDAFLHRVQITSDGLSIGDKVQMSVDPLSREATRLNHSATHLMHAALREILGDHVIQRGSMVNADRLRFDFSHFEAVDKFQIREVERLVNAQIRLNTKVETSVMDLVAAREKGAMALFGEKYGEDVRVLTMGDGFSVELCGGTHAKRTGDLGLFRIISEQGIASGIRRIEAITGNQAVSQVERNEDLLAQAASLVRTDSHSLADKLRSLVNENKRLEKTIADLNKKLSTGGSPLDFAGSTIDLGDIKLLVSQLENTNPQTLPDSLDFLKNKIGRGIVVLGTVHEGKVGLIVGVTKNITDRFDAGKIVNHIALQVDGKGGGRPDMARAGGSDPEGLPTALASVEEYVRNLL